MAADRKRRLVVWFEQHLQNPPVRLALLTGLPLPPFALLETTGRTSGKPRRTPLIDGLVGDQFWIVAEHGRHAHYVRNLQRDPHVRVKRRRRRWHSGLAHVLDHDDPLARARWLADTLGPLHRADPAVARLLGTDLLTIRIDLAPCQPDG
jgi:deazaflavin-dependent oxidoreductase (nitroreductase family)